MYLLLKRLWRHISVRRRKQFGLLMVLMVFVSFAEIISIGAVVPFLGVLTAPERVFAHPLAQPVIHILDIAKPEELVLLLTVVFSVAALFSGALRWLLLWAQTRLSFAAGADISISIYRRTLYQPYAVHVARNSSSVIAGISQKANVVVSKTILPISVIFGSCLMLIAILSVLFAMEPSIAMLSFGGLGAIYFVIVVITKKRLSINGLRISHESSRVIKALQEGLGGIRDVLIDGSQSTYCNIYRNADLPLRRASANNSIIGSSPRFGIEALGMVLIAALAYSLAGQKGDITEAIPILGALALGAQRLLPVLQQGYSSWALLRGGQANLFDALELLEQPLPDYAEAPLSKPISFKDCVKLDNLSFRYTPDAPWALRQVDLTLPRGSRIGFMGTTGSGKSTLLDLMMALLQPTEGRLLIDDIPITQENHRAWQAHIAHVPQTIFLADASIVENIAFGIAPEDIDFERVCEAARKAQIAETIETWDKQYDTVVGERGVRLSGGQRQRIGIARALYKRADVIVFDEATSALDNETENAVMAAIEGISQEVTVLIVAHRLTTLKGCDQIIELKNGGISRIGTYLEIVGQG